MYGTVSGVFDLTGVQETQEGEDRIADWIEEADAEIEKKLGRTFSPPVPLLVTRLSNLLVAVRVLERLKAEGSLSAFSLGGLQEKDPLAAVESAVKDYEKEAEEIFRLYRAPVVKSSEYEHIDEGS